MVDDIIIKVKAGNGGDGKVAFNKNLMALGPVGGSGGNGGSIYFEGVADLGILKNFRFKKDLFAEDGENGRGQFIDGKRGEELILKAPVGTVIHNLANGETHEVMSVGEKILVAQGGHGGKGNFHFRGPKNTSPTRFQFGLPGESAELHLELKLIADVGLIGLPNGGKSSLLNELTSANSKVANYPFTTLEPNLGVYYDLILADIPGLIEGASSGKGLGIKFLKHVERTKILFHLVACDSANLIKDYATVRAELKKYNPELLDKKEYVFLSKSDELNDKDLAKVVKKFEVKKIKVYPLSILIDESLENVRKILNKIAEDKIAKSRPTKKKVAPEKVSKKKIVKKAISKKKIIGKKSVKKIPKR